MMSGDINLKLKDCNKEVPYLLENTTFTVKTFPGKVDVFESFASPNSSECPLINFRISRVVKIGGRENITEKNPEEIAVVN